MSGTSRRDMVASGVGLGAWRRSRAALPAAEPVGMATIVVVDAEIRERRSL